MTDFEREIQPTRREYNVAFLRQRQQEHAVRARGNAGRAEEPEPNATFLGWMTSRINALVPQVEGIDATIRTGSVNLGAFVALAVRRAIEFTAIFAMCSMMHASSPALALLTICWCAACMVTAAAVLQFMEHDESLFFYRLAGLRAWGALFTFLPILLQAEPEQSLSLVAFAGGLWIVMMFPDFDGVADAYARSGRLLLAAMLTALLGTVPPKTSGFALVAFGLLLGANYLAMTPVVLYLAGWFAANRYTPLATLRRFDGYGPPAGCLGVLRSLCIHLCALSTATACCLILARTAADSVGDSNQLPRILTLAGQLSCIAALHWFVSEGVVYGRLPRPWRFLGSYYATWRSLAAWLSETCDEEHPAAFRFARPWTSTSARSALIGFVLALNAGVIVTLLRDYAVALTEVRASADAEAMPPEHDWWRLLELEPLMGLVLAAIIGPPILLFVLLHATWGPTLTAFRDYFDAYDRNCTPPVLWPRRRRDAKHGVDEEEQDA